MYLVKDQDGRSGLDILFDSLMNSWPQVTEDRIVVRHLQGCLLIQTKLLIKPEHSGRAWHYTLIGGVTTRNDPKIVKFRMYGININVINISKYLSYAASVLVAVVSMWSGPSQWYTVSPALRSCALNLHRLQSLGRTN